MSVGQGKEPPCLGPPRVLIGAAGTNGPIKGRHFPDWVCGGRGKGRGCEEPTQLPIQNARKACWGMTYPLEEGGTCR